MIHQREVLLAANINSLHQMIDGIRGHDGLLLVPGLFVFRIVLLP